MIEQDLNDRYMAAMHAMQSGVKTRMQREGVGDDDTSETSRKHLRVGVNSALISNGALLDLLIEKGVITREEYVARLVIYTERDVQSYEQWIADDMGVERGRIRLG